MSFFFPRSSLAWGVRFALVRKSPPIMSNDFKIREELDLVKLEWLRTMNI